jgi:hypothetical protein
MEARIIIPTADGERLTYELRLHHGGGRKELKIVFNTSEEPFERWLFYLLRDIGAHVVVDETGAFRECLGLGATEAGIVAASDITEELLPRHATA